MMDNSKLYPWRSGLFHSYTGENGEFESMVFCLDSKSTPDEKILSSIVKKGGFVTRNPSDDLYTIHLVNTKTHTYNSDIQFNEKHDLFDCTFIERCLEKNQLVDLNVYRIGELSFEQYDANEILNRRLRWDEIKKKQAGHPVASSSTTNTSLNQVLPTTSKKSKPLAIEPNEITEVPSASKNISSPPPVVKGLELDTIKPSKRKNVLESTSAQQSEHSSTEGSQKNSRFSDSSSQAGSSGKKKFRIVDSSPSSGSTTEITPQRLKRHPRKRLSKKNLQPSDETLALQSVTQNSGGNNAATVTKIFDEITALSKTDLYPKQKEKVLQGPITRNKSKTLSLSPQNSIPSLKKRVTSNGATSTSVASTSPNNGNIEFVLNNRTDSSPKPQSNGKKRSNLILSKISLRKSRAFAKVSVQKSSISNNVAKSRSSTSTGPSTTTVQTLVPSTSRSFSKPASSSQGSSKSAREKSANLSKSKDPSNVPALSNDVENGDSDSSSSTRSSIATVQESVSSSSKAPRSVSVQSSSSQGSSKSAREKSVNNANSRCKRQRQTINVSKETAPASFRPPACSSPYSYGWLSALRSVNEPSCSQQKPDEISRVRPNRRNVSYIKDNSTLSISSVESVFEDDFNDRTGSSYASTTTRKRPYTQQEKDAILKFVCQNDYHENVRGNLIWKTLEKTELIPGRTWQSLREHFNKQIFPKLKHNRKLKDEDKKKFERAMKVVKLKQKIKAPV